MIKRTVLHICVLFILTLLLCSKGYASSQEEPVYAKIDGKALTASDLKGIVKFYTRGTQNIYNTNPKDMEAMLQSYFEAKTMSRIALDKGLDKDPDIKTLVELTLINIYTQAYLGREIKDRLSVSDAEASLYYKARQEEFRTPEMIKARHILIRFEKNASVEAKASAEQKAKALLDRIKAGEDFAKVATEASEDKASQKKGGDIGYVTRGKTVKPFEEAAFQLRVGEVSGLVGSSFGWHIIKVEDKKAEGVQPFEKVKEDIRKKILSELVSKKTREFVEKVMKEVKTEIYSDNVKKLQKDKKAE